MKRGCLGVSLGNSNERGNKLAAIVDWMSSEFDSAVIDLSDTLNRWNESDASSSPATAAARLAGAGTDWLRNNQPFLDRFTIPYHVVRWDEWLRHPQFPETRAAFAQLAARPGPLNALITADTDAFMNRRALLGQPVTAQTRHNSRAFLIEEMTVHTLLYRAMPGTARIYPGDDLQSIAALRAGRIEWAPAGLQGVPMVSLRVEPASRFALGDRPPLVTTPALRRA